MKKFILSLLVLVPTICFADSPQALAGRKFHYTWSCIAGDNSGQVIELQLETQGSLKGLYMTHSGYIGTRLDENIIRLLAAKNYSALNGMIVKDKYGTGSQGPGSFSHSMIFVAKGDRMNVRIIFDNDPSLKRDALNCKANF